MYPSKEHPYFGTFVKQTEEILRDNDLNVSVVKMTKTSSKLYRISQYIKYYLEISYNIIFKENDFIYIHYATHTAPIINLFNLFFNLPKTIVNVHGSDVEPVTKSGKRLQKSVNKLFKNTYRIIAPSSYFKKNITEKFSVAEEKIVVFPSGGINKSVFYEFEKDKKLNNKKFVGLDNTKFILGYIGRLEYNKGWNIFLETIKELDKQNYPIHGVVVGNGSEIGEFNEYLKDLKIDKLITHYKLLPHKKLPDIYNMFDVFLFPTMRKESLGLVGLEAMACGVPVIGSDYAGLTDYIKDGYNGYSFQVGSLKECIQKTKKYLDLDMHEKNIMSKNSKITSEKYYIENITDNLINVFMEGKI